METQPQFFASPFRLNYRFPFSVFLRFCGEFETDGRSCIAVRSWSEASKRWAVSRMVYSDYVQQRIVLFHKQGLKAPSIAKALRSEDINVSRVGIHKLLVKYQETGTVARHTGSGRPAKVTETIKTIVKEQMRKDDETSASQLQKILSDRGFHVSLRTIVRCRSSLGWTYRGSAYCQLIRDVNKTKRLEYATANLHYHFEDVIFADDECTVQLETHRRICCRERGEAWP